MHDRNVAARPRRDTAGVPSATILPLSDTHLRADPEPRIYGRALTTSILEA